MGEQERVPPAEPTLDELVKQTEAEPTEEQTPPAEAEPTETTQPEGADGAGADAGAGQEGGEEDEQPAGRLPGSERLKRRLQQAEAELAQLRQSTPQGAEITREMIFAEIGLPPRREDYGGDVLGFERALTAYELDARQAVRAIRSRTQQQQQAHLDRMRDAAEAHQDHVEAFRKIAPDYDTVVQSVPNLRVSPLVESLILEAGEKSAHIVYYLAKHPNEVHVLNRMSEREAARAIGRLEVRATSQSPPRTQTQASRPATPPRGGAPATRSTDQEVDAAVASLYPRRGAPSRG